MGTSIQKYERNSRFAKTLSLFVLLGMALNPSTVDAARLNLSYTCVSDMTQFVSFHHKLTKLSEASNSAGELIELDDGSVWWTSAHSKDTLARWEIGDEVHLTIHNSWYFFDSVVMQNDSRDTSVRIKLISSPLALETAEDPQATKVIYSAYGSHPANFKQNLSLNNSSLWEMDWSYGLNGRDLLGFPVYEGYIRNDQVCSNGFGLAFFIVIKTIGKRNTWQWARQGNYRYYFQ